jgi:hypothetical protein
LLGDLLETVRFRRHELPCRAVEGIMKQKQRWRDIAGLTVHVIVGGFMVFLGGLMIASAWARLVCLPLPTGVEAAVQFEVSDYVLPRQQAVEVAAQAQVCVYLMILGVGQLVIGLLLMTPSTYLAGTVLAGTFLGGAISLCITHAGPYFLPAALLVLTWTGAYLRNPALPGGFSGCERDAATTLNGNGVAKPRRALERWVEPRGSVPRHHGTEPTQK